jgi:lipoprotein-anchoring transpeptidase ErfK/SrfK
LLALAASALAQTPPSPPAVKRALPLNDSGEAYPPAAAPSARTQPITVKRALPLEPAPVAPPATVKPPATPEKQAIKQALPLHPDDKDIAITPEAPKVADNVKPQGDDALRLQIFLDESKFGPGIIDGKAGRFTELAVRSWNEANGHPPDDWTAVVKAARKAVPDPLANAIVPDWARDWVNPNVPYKDRHGQAKLKRMSYRSVGELMAERYHCDESFLATLNGERKISRLKGHDTVVVPNVAAFRVEDLTGARFEADETMSKRHVVVDTRINQLRVFEAAPPVLVFDDEEPTTTTAATPAASATPVKPMPNRGLLASFPITPGKPQFIKLGIWEIRSCVELPVWRYDQRLLDTGKRSNDGVSIPPGPNSPVGVIWNGTSRSGIGLHGTSDPETIGRARSAGCIRLANWDAIRLPTLIRPGATVEIR